MSELINLSEISKAYPKTKPAGNSLSALFKILLGRKVDAHTEVLSNINLTVQKGESLAIIGRNGAGKSTLLKIISGIINPSSGDLNISGKIGALLELGSGFETEYTGIENLRMASTLAGIASEEIDKKVKEMIRFADIGEYINEPIKHYSSGMIVRLGFSVITVTSPDLLITDEVLAVGDEKFQRKCMQWIDGYLAKGGTLLLVSHSMYHVQKICKNAIWLENGKIKMAGDAYQVSQAYQSQFISEASKPEHVGHINPNNYHITSFELLDNEFNKVDSIESGQDLFMKVKIFSPDGRSPGLSIGVIRSDEIPVYGTFSDLHEVKPQRIDESHFEFNVTFPNINLLPGLYVFKAHTMSPELVQLIDTSEIEVRILGKTREMGVSRLETIWS